MGRGREPHTHTSSSLPRTTADSKCLERNKSRKVIREEEEGEIAKLDLGNCMSQNQKAAPKDMSAWQNSAARILFPCQRLPPGQRTGHR